MAKLAVRSSFQSFISSLHMISTFFPQKAYPGRGTGSPAPGPSPRNRPLPIAARGCRSSPRRTRTRRPRGPAPPWPVPPPGCGQAAAGGRDGEPAAAGSSFVQTLDYSFLVPPGKPGRTGASLGPTPSYDGRGPNDTDNQTKPKNKHT